MSVDVRSYVATGLAVDKGSGSVVRDRQRRDYDRGEILGEVRPAATMISAGLADPRMRIEIEVTARLFGSC